MKSLIFMAVLSIYAVLYISGQELSHQDKYNHSQIQSNTTGVFMVSGSCEMCKARIEKAARIDGVSRAEWNSDKQLLTIVYDPSEVTSDHVMSGIAKAGHDTEKFKAPDDVYNKLPGCCKYERVLSY